MNTAGKTLEWRKSSYSGRDYNCVEVADLPGRHCCPRLQEPGRRSAGFPHS